MNVREFVHAWNEQQCRRKTKTFQRRRYDIRRQREREMPTELIPKIREYPGMNGELKNFLVYTDIIGK